MSAIDAPVDDVRLPDADRTRIERLLGPRQGPLMADALQQQISDLRYFDGVAVAGGTAAEKRGALLKVAKQADDLVECIVRLPQLASNVAAQHLRAAGAPDIIGAGCLLPAARPGAGSPLI